MGRSSFSKDSPYCNRGNAARARFRGARLHCSRSIRFEQVPGEHGDQTLNPHSTPRSEIPRRSSHYLRKTYSILDVLRKAVNQIPFNVNDVYNWCSACFEQSRLGGCMQERSLSNQSETWPGPEKRRSSRIQIDSPAQLKVINSSFSAPSIGARVLGA